MNQGEQENKGASSGPLYVGDLINNLKTSIIYIKSKWVIVLAVSVLGALAGLVYSLYTKPVYAAVCTFVLEEGSKSGALGQYAGLASLAGIDINGNNSSIFQGDNILELYKSRLMIEQALLSEANFNNKKELLINRYAEFNKLRKRWKRKDGIDTIVFSGDPEKFNRKQDSLITDIVEKINKNNLSVGKPDKKLNIIQVEVVAKDELFAKEFTNMLVAKVNDFYVQTKTKKEYQNVQILQKQADSVKSVLNSSLSGVASAIDATPNANPQDLSLRVPSQKKQIDVQASSAVYGEIVKNLEISKISLRQEMPLIQVIDKPILPLRVNKVNELTSVLIGTLLAMTLITGIIIVKMVTEKPDDHKV